MPSSLRLSSHLHIVSSFPFSRNLHIPSLNDDEARPFSNLAGSTAALAPAQTGKAFTTARSAFTVVSMPGALAPMGFFFDPLSFAKAPLKKYREAGVARDRVAMLAVIGFFIAGAVEGSSFLCVFAPAKTGKASTTARSAFIVDSMPGAPALMGFFVPPSFATDADGAHLKKYRIVMLEVVAVIGFAKATLRKYRVAMLEAVAVIGWSDT